MGLFRRKPEPEPELQVPPHPAHTGPRAIPPIRPRPSYGPPRPPKPEPEWSEYLKGKTLRVTGSLVYGLLTCDLCGAAVYKHQAEQHHNWHAEQNRIVNAFMAERLRTLEEDLAEERTRPNL